MSAVETFFSFFSGELVKLTRIRNLDANGTTLEHLSVKLEGGLETVHTGKLGVGEALGALLLAVLDDPDTDDITSGEEIGDRVDGSIIREVAEMGRVRGLVGELNGTSIAGSIT